MPVRKASHLTANAQAYGIVEAGILWEWNGTDITQFGDGAGTPDYTYGSPDGTLSVGTVPGSGADVPSGNVLIYTTGSTPGTTAHYVINDLPVLPERFIYRARVGPVVGGVLAESCMVFARQDQLHWMGTAYNASSRLQAQFGNNRDGLYTAAHFINPDSKILSIPSGILIEADCMLREPDTGVDPQINVVIREARALISAFGKGGDTWSSFGAPPAIYDSSWQSGGTIKQPGVAFLNNGASQQTWIGELQILEHPWGG